MALIRTVTLLFATLVAAAAFATGEIEGLMTPADRERLEKFEETRAMALSEARAGGAPADIAIIDAVANAPAMSMEGFDPVGEWRCRTIKAGGPVPLVVYGWFRCRISDDGAGWMLEKLTGSQRTKGRFFTESDERNIYLGAYFTAGDAPPPYGSGPESDQAGYMIRTGADTFRIEFPAPTYESRLDILEFRR